ncbi:hypothetical protein F5X97DRAFT_191204 [Nemania serpens]|nr:hypothetical protein F5X97DRAFT_191204 [Nemania serpens]
MRFPSLLFFVISAQMHGAAELEPRATRSSVSHYRQPQQPLPGLENNAVFSCHGACPTADVCLGLGVLMWRGHALRDGGKELRETKTRACGIRIPGIKSDWIGRNRLLSCLVIKHSLPVTNN